jgi:protein SDA1
VRLAMEQPLTEKQMAQLRRRTAGLDAKKTDSSHKSDDEDDDLSVLQKTNDETVDPKSLESSKKSRQDYEGRMASIKEGREGRLKYGSRMGKHNSKASVSNSIKSKLTKNPIMLAHKPSVRAKKRRSLKESQAASQSHAKRQKMKK